MTPASAYILLPIEDLLELRGLALDALKGTFKTGVSYSRPGFSFTKLTPKELTEVLHNLNLAIEYKNGGHVNTVYPDFSEADYPQI